MPTLPPPEVPEPPPDAPSSDVPGLPMLDVPAPPEVLPPPPALPMFLDLPGPSALPNVPLPLWEGGEEFMRNPSGISLMAPKDPYRGMNASPSPQRGVSRQVPN